MPAGFAGRCDPGAGDSALASPAGTLRVCAVASPQAGASEGGTGFPLGCDPVDAQGPAGDAPWPAPLSHPHKCGPCSELRRPLLRAPTRFAVDPRWGGARRRAEEGSLRDPTPEARVGGGTVRAPWPAPRSHPRERGPCSALRSPPRQVAHAAACPSFAARRAALAASALPARDAVGRPSSPQMNCAACSSLLISTPVWIPKPSSI